MTNRRLTSVKQAVISVSVQLGLSVRRTHFLLGKFSLRYPYVPVVTVEPLGVGLVKEAPIVPLGSGKLCSVVLPNHMRDMTHCQILGPHSKDSCVFVSMYDMMAFPNSLAEAGTRRHLHATLTAFAGPGRCHPPPMTQHHGMPPILLLAPKHPQLSHARRSVMVCAMRQCDCRASTSVLTIILVYLLMCLMLYIAVFYILLENR